jgi:hypothetical protein
MCPPKSVLSRCELPVDERTELSIRRGWERKWLAQEWNSTKLWRGAEVSCSPLQRASTGGPSQAYRRSTGPFCAPNHSSHKGPSFAVRLKSLRPENAQPACLRHARPSQEDRVTGKISTLYYQAKTLMLGCGKTTTRDTWPRCHSLRSSHKILYHCAQPCRRFLSLTVGSAQPCPLDFFPPRSTFPCKNLKLSQLSRYLGLASLT